MQKLTPRLKAIADLVCQGARIVDIGTDHGYLPVFLVKSKRIKSAVASDVNIGPLSSCDALVRQEGLCDAIKTVLSNGFENICRDDYDTVIIAGMGGELIADILSKEDLKDKHLILNPMTHPEITREYLYSNDFEINNDLIIKEGKRYYNVFDAKYSGVSKEKSRADYFLGNIKDFSHKEYFSHLLNYLNNKEKSGEDYSDVIKALEDIYDNC